MAIGPLFSKRLVMWATSSPVSLYGLGIPPAQFESLAAAGGGDMAGVLRTRLERLACGTGRNLVTIARRYPRTRAIGGDCRLERLYRDYAWYGVVRASSAG